jgi:hypothetical protein
MMNSIWRWPGDTWFFLAAKARRAKLEVPDETRERDFVGELVIFGQLPRHAEKLGDGVDVVEIVCEKAVVLRSRGLVREIPNREGHILIKFLDPPVW